MFDIWQHRVRWWPWQEQFWGSKKGPLEWAGEEKGNEGWNSEWSEGCEAGARERNWWREEDSVSLHIHIGDIRAGFYAEGICPVKREINDAREREQICEGAKSLGKQGRKSSLTFPKRWLWAGSWGKMKRKGRLVNQGTAYTKTWDKKEPVTLEEAPVVRQDERGKQEEAASLRGRRAGTSSEKALQPWGLMFLCHRQKKYKYVQNW